MDLLKNKAKRKKKRENAEVFMDGFGDIGLENTKYSKELNIFMASISKNNPNRLLTKEIVAKQVIKFCKELDIKCLLEDKGELYSVIELASKYNMLTAIHNSLVVTEATKKFMNNKVAELV